jgi:hypothetical protein
MTAEFQNLFLLFSREFIRAFKAFALRKQLDLKKISNYILTIVSLFQRLSPALKHTLAQLISVLLFMMAMIVFLIKNGENFSHSVNENNRGEGWTFLIELFHQLFACKSH